MATASDVIQSQLQKAYALHPGHLMPGAVIAALGEAGYTILSNDELDNEVALAYEAGVDAGCEA